MRGNLFWQLSEPWKREKEHTHETQQTSNKYEREQKPLSLRENELKATFAMKSDSSTEPSQLEGPSNVEWNIQTLRELCQIFLIWSRDILPLPPTNLELFQRHYCLTPSSLHSPTSLLCSSIIQAIHILQTLPHHSVSLVQRINANVFTALSCSIFRLAKSSLWLFLSLNVPSRLSVYHIFSWRDIFIVFVTWLLQ